MDPAFWQGRRVWLTGHTGFKGSWLTLWLQVLGAEVHGFSHDVTPLYEEAGVADGLAAIETDAPAFAVIDMRLGDGNGLDVIERLKERRPDARGVILTGYGNIATAVTAVRSALRVPSLAAPLINCHALTPAMRKPAVSAEASSLCPRR